MHLWPDHLLWPCHWSEWYMSDINGHKINVTCPIIRILERAVIYDNWSLIDHIHKVIARICKISTSEKPIQGRIIINNPILLHVYPRNICRHLFLLFYNTVCLKLSLVLQPWTRIHISVRYQILKWESSSTQCIN